MRSLGIPTRLDGLHFTTELPKLACNKVSAFSGRLHGLRRNRQRSIELSDASTRGTCFFLGSVFSLPLARADALIGSSQRRVARQAAVAGRRLPQYTPRISFHAPRAAIGPRPAVNNPVLKASIDWAAPAPSVSGLGQAHGGVLLAVANFSTFVACFVTGGDTPGRRASHSELALIAWQLGCQSDPLSFGWHLHVARVRHMGSVSRALHWLLRTFPAMPLRWDDGPPAWFPCAAQHWPGRSASWHGITQYMREQDSVLLLAGVVEVANLCDKAGARYLLWPELRARTAGLRAALGQQGRLEHECLLAEHRRWNISPVPHLPALEAAAFMSGQTFLAASAPHPRAPYQGAVLRRAVERRRLLALVDSSDRGDAILRPLRCGGPRLRDRACLDGGFAALVGDSTPVPPPRWTAARSQLEVDNSTVLSVSWYDRKAAISERTWLQRVGSGLGRIRPGDDARAREHTIAVLAIWQIDPDTGWLRGPYLETPCGGHRAGRWDAERHSLSTSGENVSGSFEEPIVSLLQTKHGSCSAAQFTCAQCMQRQSLRPPMVPDDTTRTGPQNLDE